MTKRHYTYYTQGEIDMLNLGIVNNKEEIAILQQYILKKKGWQVHFAKFLLKISRIKTIIRNYKKNEHLLKKSKLSDFTTFTETGTYTNKSFNNCKEKNE